MYIHLRHNGEVKRLPKAVQNYMKHRFILLPEYLGLLRCFEYNDEVNGKRIRHFKIFDPVKARDMHVLIKNRADLEQNPQMLLFEGYIDYQGNAYAADRRQPIRRTKTR